MPEPASSPPSAVLDGRHLRHALGRFATGVAVVTTRTRAGRCEGLTVNSFAALSLDPPLVLWSLQRSAPSLAGFLEAGCFAVNVLGSHQAGLSRHFATRQQDKFTGLDIAPGLRGCPLLAGSIAFFECETERSLEGGDHRIFIGQVVQARYHEGEPLIFHGGGYCVPSPLTHGVPPLAAQADGGGRAGT